MRPEEDGGAPPQIRQLTVDEGVLRYLDEPAVIDVTVRVSTRGDDPERPTSISFSGTYRKAPLKGEAQAGPVLNLQNTQEPFPMRVRVRKGDTLIEADDHLILFIPHKRQVREVERLFQVSATFF